MGSHKMTTLRMTTPWRDPRTGKWMLRKRIPVRLVKASGRSGGTVTLGKGSPVKVWATKDKRGGGRKVPKDDALAVGEAMLGRFPFLARPADLVPVRLAVAVPGGFARRSTRGSILTFHLMGLEAEAMTRAVRTLRKAGVLALPIHDSLVVPASAERVAMDVMRAAFRAVVGVEVRLTVARLP